MNEPLAIALRARGLSLSGLAESLSVNKSTVTRWAQGRLPAERVVEIEKITGISRRVLRPDLYPAELDLSGPGAAQPAQVQP